MPNIPGTWIPILIVAIVVGIPVICGTLVTLAKILKGQPVDKNEIWNNAYGDDGSGKKNKRKHGRQAVSAEEQQLLQDMHRSLTKLETRIESLETIFIEQQRSRRDADTERNPLS